MNPEEGELRPAAARPVRADRRDRRAAGPALRAEVVRRRLAFDADPDAFVAAYADAERALTDGSPPPASCSPEVELTDAALAQDRRGLRRLRGRRHARRHRHRPGRVAHAAWHGRYRGHPGRHPAAARLALPHRRRRNPFDAPGLDEELLDRLLGDDEPEPEPPRRRTTARPRATARRTALTSGSRYARRSSGATATAERRCRRRRRSDPTIRRRGPGPRRARSARPRPTSCRAGADAVIGAADRLPGQAVHGARHRRGRAGASASGRSPPTGRTVGADPRRQRRPLHLVATIRAAAPHQQRPRPHRRPAAGSTAATCGWRSREGRESNLVLFCVDASGSMAARRRMEQVKTAILSLLLDAYQRRDKVGLVTFRGDSADARAAADLTRSTSRPRGCADLPAGGRTPLAEGLLMRRGDAAGRSGSATRGAGRCWSWSPTAGPPTARTRSHRRRQAAGAARRARASAPWSSTARPAGSRLGLAGQLAAATAGRVRAARARSAPQALAGVARRGVTGGCA